jgi:hypothetical protein
VRDLNESMTLGHTVSRAFATIAPVLVFLVTWMPAAWALDDPGPVFVAEDRPTVVDDTQVLLVYTEDVDPPEHYRGGGMIGVINSIFAGETEAPLTAFFRVPVSAKIQVNKDAPWRVTLTLGELKEHIGDNIKEAPNLSAEAHFMVLLLEDWHKDLSEEDTEQLRQFGLLDIEVVGPMDALQTWIGPDTIIVTVGLEEVGEVRDIRFMRKTEDSGYVPISVVLPYEPFHVEARFQTLPHVDEEVVTLNAQRVVVRQTAEDQKVYRSGELYLSPPPEESGDGSTAE